MYRLTSVLSFVLSFGSLFAAQNPEQHSGTIGGGASWATDYYVRDSGVNGPAVVVVGGVHGDEAAGAAAAEQIRHWPIVKGKLVVIPRANVAALVAHKRLIPGLDASVNNLNRNFPRAKGTNAPSGELAAALWDFVRSQKPNWVIDLHEGSGFHDITPTTVGSSIIVFPTEEGRVAAAAMLAAVNASITNASHLFKQIGPPVDGSLARAAGTHLGANAMIIETTIKSQPLSKRVRQHRVMVQALFKQIGIIDASVTPDRMTSRDPASSTASQSRRRLVALYDSEGIAGAGVPRVTEQLGRQTNITVVSIGPDDIRSGALGQFDVVIFTGGSASRVATPLGDDGRERVKKFVENGGGYIGICAGAYLATSGFSWGLKILNAKTVSPKWQRGHGYVQAELTEQGRTIFGSRSGPFEIKYANGPILCPADTDSLPEYDTLAVFRTEVAEHNTPKGIMIGSPAIAAGRCGKGRVMCFSPHPEQTTGLEDFVPRALDWVMRR